MTVGSTLKKAAKKVKSATKKVVRGAGKALKPVTSALGVGGKKRKKSSRKKATAKR